MRANKQKRSRVAQGKPPRRQLNIRIEAALYRTLECLAQAEQRSVPNLAQRLVEQAVQGRLRSAGQVDDIAADEIAKLAVVGQALSWLAEEPDLYDDTSGEPA